MTWESFVAKAKALPPEKQRAILDQLESLLATSERVTPVRSPAGILSGFDVRYEDFQRARRAVWPRSPKSR